MIGSREVAQGALFYEFWSEDRITQDHLISAIDRFVDLGGTRQHLAPFHSNTGRPSVDPELMFRMLLLGYCFGIRSAWCICEEVHLNLADRRFCNLDLTPAVPDHSTFSKNRHGRFRGSTLLRELFEPVVRGCISEGLVKGSDFTSDASLIRADAAKMHSVPAVQWNDGQADAEAAPRAVRDCLESVDDAAFGAATDVRPKVISCSDPASQWTAAMNGSAIFAYSVTYLITPTMPSSSVSRSAGQPARPRSVRLRGPNGAKDEVHLARTAPNLHRPTKTTAAPPSRLSPSLFAAAPQYPGKESLAGSTNDKRSGFRE